MQNDRTYRTLLLETLTAFSDVCRQAGIRWWLAFGSAIGAVRHGGMIPWDDDVDVMMPRADYERFLRLQVPGYEILSLSCSADDLPFGYAKFLHRGTTLIEQRRYPRPLGVFIDVFPLDAAGPDPEAFRCAYRGALRDYVRSFRLHFWDEWCSDLFHGRWHAVFAAVKDLLLYRPRKASLRRRVLALDRRAAEVSGAGWCFGFRCFGCFRYGWGFWVRCCWCFGYGWCFWGRQRRCGFGWPGKFRKDAAVPAGHLVHQLRISGHHLSGAMVLRNGPRPV